MFSIAKTFSILTMISVFLIMSSHAMADDICDADIFDLKLGISKEAVTKEMLKQGFTGTGIVSKRGMMHFVKDESEHWPEGVKITAEQQKVMTMMQDPRRKAGIEKRAKTDPKLKQLLAEISALPPTPKAGDKINITVFLRVTSTSNRIPIVQSITAKYQFANDNYVPGYSYTDFSSTHKSVDTSLWQEYCVDVIMQKDQQFTDKNETHERSCAFSPDMIGTQPSIRITISPHRDNKQAGQCNFSYQSYLNAATEVLGTR